MLLTTLQGASLFHDSQIFPGADPNAPISVIRVRVADVTGPDPVSRERVRRVAQTIQERTGLAVDITAGSSPTSILVRLPKGKFGQPSLLVREGWVMKGVALVVLKALDRKSVVLFLLVLIVTGLFLVNASLASVRTRRTEIGTLLALGWTRRAIFEAALGEAALTGLVAGVAGAGLGAALASLLHLQMAVDRILLIAPVAVVLATLAGLPPAWWASRGRPLDAVRPGISGVGRGRKARTMLGLAIANVIRVPARSALAALGVLIGVAAASLLIAVQLAFHGALIGSTLGAFVSIQVRVVDYVSVGLVVLLAAFCVADVLSLNLIERAVEVVTLRASGWRNRDLRRLVVMEGAILGVLSCVPGALLGAGLAAAVGGHLSGVVPAAILSAGGGVCAVVLASLAPVYRVTRIASQMRLGEE
jgi:ABC-type lipoprotein release transport system permease subunit